jgi:predicted GNAT family N-acyltransferase
LVNELEKLQAHVALLEQRVTKLEVDFKGATAMRADEREAHLVAQELGFTADVVRLPARSNQAAALKRGRERLARELKGKGWSADRIARALNCGERTVRRWTA